MNTQQLLLAISAELPADPRVDVDDHWTQVGNHWALRIVVRLSVASTEFMPSESVWQIVLDEIPDRGSVRIYPDSTDGMTATFPHQDLNNPANPGQIWRAGKPCLERPHAVLNRAGNHDEPDDLRGRIEWHIWRLLAWVDAAAEGKLLQPGDAFELPMRPNWDSAGAIAFREDRNNGAEQPSSQAHWGFAKLASIQNAKDTLVVTEFHDDRGVFMKASLSNAGSSGASSTALWVMLPEAPILAPWRFPETWGELVDLCNTHNLNLSEVVLKASQQRAFGKGNGATQTLLLGFAIAEKVGANPDRIHWLSITGLKLARPVGQHSGRRRTPAITSVQNGDKLTWGRTENWASDQLRTRGQAEHGLRSAKVLVIGCGSLGSSIADNLLRAGVTDLTLMDSDAMRVGNLGRHVLTMPSIGHNKAEALARQLNIAMPDANVVAVASAFPPNSVTTRAMILDCDVIVDCSAEDRVLNSMATFPWGGEKRFYSFSMTWSAKGLLAFSASETAFPAVDARSRFAAATGPARPPDAAVRDGIGCWVPVFPAAADDVSLWGAIAAKFIRRGFGKYDRQFVHFEQSDDGTVAVVDA